MAKGRTHQSSALSKKAVELVGTMMGSYNVASCINLLKDGYGEIAQLAADALKKTLPMYDAFNNVMALSQTDSYTTAHPPTQTFRFTPR